jgi:hypothetical protein
MPALIDRTGQRYGRLVVIAREGSDGHGSAVWRCRCDCGRVIAVAGGNLQRLRSRSCGCYRAEASRARGRALARPSWWRRVLTWRPT